MLSALSESTQSESVRCLRQRRVSTPFVRVSAECHHPLSGSAPSVTTRCPGQRAVFRQLLSGLTRKTFLNQSPYKRYRKIKCSNVVRVDAECHHPLSGATRSVTSLCPGRHRVSPSIVQGKAEI